MPAVGGEGHAQHRPLMSVEAAQLLAGVEIPQAHRAVEPAGKRPRPATATAATPSWWPTNSRTCTSPGPGPALAEAHRRRGAVRRGVDQAVNHPGDDQQHDGGGEGLAHRPGAGRHRRRRGLAGGGPGGVGRVPAARRVVAAGGDDPAAVRRVGDEAPPPRCARCSTTTPGTATSQTRTTSSSPAEATVRRPADERDRPDRLRVALAVAFERGDRAP